eukprot:TRINITY_DN10209_c0_g1_i1.p1 TRINITY_DN10209_c0_g1~~TRINITY_DN10209_c0_g1_i1.p1  ORF type:complete len:322 (+),score=42.09 TRINITY_DN10209_c0_g1_i1:51-968(+)
MSRSGFVWESQDVGNILILEHINVEITDQRVATTFYVEGLGLTRDPYERITATIMWINIGLQQIHLVEAREPQVISGVIGLIVPDIERVIKTLAVVENKLKNTKFSWNIMDSKKFDLEYIPSSGSKILEVTCPWGNKFRVYSNTLNIHGNLGLPYIELFCNPGTAKKIFEYFVEYFGAIGTLENDDTLARVWVGPWQQLIYRETKEPSPYDGWHICFYVADFTERYHKFARENLLFHDHPFEDTFRTIQEAYKWRQFRTKDFVDVKDPKGSAIYQLHLEVRSVYHPFYRRTLVNRFGNIGIFCNQ